MTAAFAAVVDANTLVNTVVRDFLLEAHDSNLFRLCLTEDVLRETRSTLMSANFRLSGEVADGIVQYITGSGTREVFATDSYAHLIPCMAGRIHPKDAHLAAAAYAARAETIVTFDLRDIPDGRFPTLQTRHPDRFLLALLEHRPELLLDRLAQRVARYPKPPNDLRSVLERRRAQLPAFVPAALALLP